MLQQTQVVTVLPYYYRFLERFPRVQELACADESEVMRLWEGLGYYRRARQMHAASKLIAERHNGLFPTSFEEVLALPGIGRYTAGAICSFAYDAATPIVEANTQRLFARLLAWDKPLAERQSQDKLWEFATALLPDGNGSRTTNYAAMELGSLVCKPQPECEKCPLIKMCPTASAGLQASIPAPKAKTVYSDRFEVALLIQSPASVESVHNEPQMDRQFLVRQCGPNEWWTGLWDFPRIEIDEVTFQSIDRPLLLKIKSTTARSTIEDSADFGSEIVKRFFDRFGLRISLCGSAQRVIRHSVTRYRIQLRVCAATLAIAKKTHHVKDRNDQITNMQVLNTTDVADHSFRWVSLDELESLPLSASARKVYQYWAR